MRTHLLLPLLVFLWPIYSCFSCSMVKVQRGDTVYVGNNEDYWNPDTYLWTIKKTSQELGMVCFGFEDFFIQGAMNEAGVVFDGFTTQARQISSNPGKLSLKPQQLVLELMRHCKTVSEIAQKCRMYNLNVLSGGQLMFTDASGASIILEADTILFNSQQYSICTNFHQSEWIPGTPAPCDRYAKADSMLRAASTDPGLPLIKRTMAAIHQEFWGGGTQYTNVYNLKNGDIYLYLFHNYQEEVKLNVHELLKEKLKIRISSYFRQTQAYESYYKKYHASKIQIEKIKRSKEAQKLSPLITELRASPITGIYFNELVQKSNELLVSEKYKEAELLIDFCIELWPLSWKTHAIRASVMYKLEKYEAALRSIGKALELNPQEPELLKAQKIIQGKLKP